MGLKLIFAASSRTEVIQRFKHWKARWEVYEEPAVHCLEKDLHECLTYYNLLGALSESKEIKPRIWHGLLGRLERFTPDGMKGSALH